jgi:hypothetical protein
MRKCLVVKHAASTGRRILAFPGIVSSGIRTGILGGLSALAVDALLAEEAGAIASTNVLDGWAGSEVGLAAEGVAAGAEPFAMGLEGGLDAFAEARGATSWKNFADQMNWKSGVIDELAYPNTMVHFNLDGVDVWGGTRSGGTLSSFGRVEVSRAQPLCQVGRGRCQS